MKSSTLLLGFFFMATLAFIAGKAPAIADQSLLGGAFVLLWLAAAVENKEDKK